MINAEFFKSAETERMLGFSVSGHSGMADMGFDIVCASVSSAVMLTANTISEIFKLEAKVKDLGNEILLKLGNDPDGTGDKLLLGLLTHLYMVSEQFPQALKVVVTDR